AGAFAGARASGQVRAELGAGGLNFGLIGVSGEVSAGAGAEASGELFAQLHRTGAAGQVSAALGAGAGLGMVATVDPSFPVRLTLDKLAENKILPSSDIGQLATSTFQGVFVPDKKPTQKKPTQKKPTQKKPTQKKPTRKKPLPTAPVTLDAAASNMEERQQLQAASATLQERSKRAGKAAWGELMQATQMGRGLREGILQAMTGAFGAANAVVSSVGAGAKAIFDQATAEAGALAGELSAVAGVVAAEIRGVMQLDPRKLLEMDWEAHLDQAVARLYAAIARIEAQVQQLIARTRQSVDQLIERAVDAGTAPLSGLGKLLVGVVGHFGQRLSRTGRRMLDHFKAGIEFGEEGVPVEGMNGKVALPARISPSFAVGTQALKKVESLGADTLQGAVDKVSDTVAGGIKDGLKETNDGSAGTLAGEASTAVRLTAGAARSMVDGAAAVARHVIVPAINLARKARDAARAAAKVVSNGAKAIVGGAKAVFGWFGGLFR
ncbi:MAG: hypothetical protein AAFV53_13830, partial [Myxococcota bacterium]